MGIGEPNLPRTTSQEGVGVMKLTKRDIEILKHIRDEEGAFEVCYSNCSEECEATERLHRLGLIEGRNMDWAKITFNGIMVLASHG